MAAALAYEPGGSGAEVVSGMCPGAYDDGSLVEVLVEPRRLLDDRKLTLIWGGLGSHRPEAIADWSPANAPGCGESVPHCLQVAWHMSHHLLASVKYLGHARMACTITGVWSSAVTTGASSRCAADGSGPMCTPASGASSTARLALRHG